MPHTWKSLITYLSNITRENYNSITCCTHCGNRDSYVKWGFYSRYLFNDELVSPISYQLSPIILDIKLWRRYYASSTKR